MLNGSDILSLHTPNQKADHSWVERNWVCDTEPRQEVLGSNYGCRGAIRCCGMECAEGQTLVACLRMRALKRANNNNEWRKEAGVVRDLSAGRRVENE
jgi:hypothetical protein